MLLQQELARVSCLVRPKQLKHWKVLWKKRLWWFFWMVLRTMHRDSRVDFKILFPPVELIYPWILQNRRMALVGRDFKYHLILAPCYWQGFQPINKIIDQVTKGYIQPYLEHLQGRGIHKFSGQKKNSRNISNAQNMFNFICLNVINFFHRVVLHLCKHLYVYYYIVITAYNIIYVIISHFHFCLSK